MAAPTRPRPTPGTGTFQRPGSGQTCRVDSPCRNRRPLSLGTGVLSWTPGKAQASKCFQTSSTSRMLDVRGRLHNATSSSPPSEASAPPSCPWVDTPLWGRCGRISNPKSTRSRGCVAAAHTTRCPRPEDPSHPPQDNFILRWSAAQTPLETQNHKPGPANCILNPPNPLQPWAS